MYFDGYKRVIWVPAKIFPKPTGGFVKYKTRDGLPVGGLEK